MSITKQDALDYHQGSRPGKIEVVSTKPCLTQRDLSLAYTPGVADPCLEIEKNPQDAYKYTAKGNQVGLGGVLVSVLRVLFDLETGIGNARGVRQAEIALGQARLGGYDLDLSRPGSLVVVECVLLGNGHDGLRFERCGLVGAERVLDGGTAVAAYDGATGE